MQQCSSLMCFGTTTKVYSTKDGSWHLAHMTLGIRGNFWSFWSLIPFVDTLPSYPLKIMNTGTLPQNPLKLYKMSIGSAILLVAHNTVKMSDQFKSGSASIPNCLFCLDKDNEWAAEQSPMPSNEAKKIDEGRSQTKMTEGQQKEHCPCCWGQTSKQEAKHNAVTFEVKHTKERDFGLVAVT